MTHLPKLRLYPFLKWVSSNLSRNSFKLSEYPLFRKNSPLNCSCNAYYHSKFLSTMALQDDQNEDVEGSSITNNGKTAPRISPTTRKEAQRALFDYLHFTRSLPSLDAEHISKNSPHFLRKLIKDVNSEPDIRGSVTRFLRYHPINELEPFFESIGLDSSELVPHLPRCSMFLCDENGLIDNYNLLCSYGVSRNDVGKIYKGAREVFKYGTEVLQSKLQDFEELGIGKAIIAKAVTFNPYLLIDDVGKDFFKLVGKLQCLDCEYYWLENNLLENGYYNWGRMFELLNLLSELGCKNQELGCLLRQHPELLFDRSGKSTFSLIGFLVKFGSTKHELCSMFLQFPQIEVGKFVWNLQRAFEVLTDIKMDASDIRSIVRAHVILVGSCSLKKAETLLCCLNVGKKRLCRMIKANPLELKNWVYGAKVEAIPGNKETRHGEKIKFLSSIGFVEDSKEMEKALKSFRGRGDELHERFECLVNAGLSKEDVLHMLKTAPKVLDQPKEVIEARIRYLVSDLGYPVSSLRTFPAYFSFNTKRVKLRFFMFKWLVSQNAVRSTLSLSSILGRTESHFMKKYVDTHPKGRDTYQELKKTFTV